ncbi:MAG TPA: asparagine synthase (glutamine-hydrolyzing) [Burkholderiales bacterium]|jgi:asparagine synthase (glutamine-hydrolysing)|nr:asparagine synthase (glutamine-hydrolyzing) [Burkholderiales bacterium]
MCGIAGWVALPDSRLTAHALSDMLQAIAHRGPDDEGMACFRCATGHQVCLGHRRLAIIDPEGARQPMCDRDAGIAVVFNGEIYNFRNLRKELTALGYGFTRDSDTEVLLRAYQHWGERVVDHLRGMFAFAIWDEGHQCLFLARDRFGEKPLFLYETASGLYFASEIKALMRVPGFQGAVNDRSVWDYWAYRYVPGPATLLAGVRKLNPATTATWHQGRLTERRYWTAPDRSARIAAPPAPDAIPRFLSALDEAVRSQMVSDVPFGAFLSGGIDSSAIVALMSRHNANVRTFSVGFAEQRYSELPYARAVADHFQTKHHELVVGYRDVIDCLPKLVAFRDAPVSEPSDIPIYLLAREAARSVKMVLTGEGSDEILAGYPKHLVERVATGYQKLPRGLRAGMEPIVRALPYRFRRIKTAAINLNIEDRSERYVRWFGALSRRERARLSTLRLNGTPVADMPPFDADPGNSALRSILYFDQMSWLPDNLLERGDRMTMAASIESRVPFLDHEFAKFVSSLPDHYRLRGWRSKWILREACRQLLPERILNRPKVGFRVPVNDWFRTHLRDYLLDHLRGPSSFTRGYYEPQPLDGVLNEHMSGRQNHEKLLWALLNLEIWHRQYVRA